MKTEARELPGEIRLESPHIGFLIISNFLFYSLLKLIRFSSMPITFS